MCSSNILGDLDAKYLLKLNSFLGSVLQSSSRSRFVRCWRAKTDGWSVSTFHSNCDGKGPTVTIIKVGSYIFGGYTDVSWSSPSKYILNFRDGFVVMILKLLQRPEVKIAVDLWFVSQNYCYEISTFNMFAFLYFVFFLSRAIYWC